MNAPGDSKPIAGALLDPERAPKALGEGFVPEGPGVFLRIEQGADTGAVLQLAAGGVYILGRGGDSDIQLDDAKISRTHAEIGLFPDACVLRDLASTNGTWLNGRRVTERIRLSHGDLIRVGDTALRLSLLEDPHPLA